MDDQQFEIAQKLYQLLISTSERTLDELSELTKSPLKKVLSAISLLRETGADIVHCDNLVQLLQKNELIDIPSLSTKLNFSGIKKSILYTFATSSTNDLASMNPEHSVFITEYQKAGRGRQGKSWLSPLAQGIVLSINHHFNLPIKSLGGLNIAVAVAILKTFEIFGIKDFFVKWPNDILGKQGKVAGILIEVSGSSLFSKAIIGIGINWNVRKELLKEVTQQCMNLNPKGISRTGFIAALLVQIENTLDDFSNNGLSQILPVWNMHDNFRGHIINIKQSHNSKYAKYIGIDENGLLKVEEDGLIKTLASGEVSLRKVD